MPPASANLTAPEDCPVFLVFHHLVSLPSSLQEFLCSLLEVLNVTHCSMTVSLVFLADDCFGSFDKQILTYAQIQ